MINKPDKNKIRVARHRRTRKNIMGRLSARGWMFSAATAISMCN